MDEDIIMSIEDSQEIELENIREKRRALELNVNNVWGHSSLGIEAKKAAMTMLSTKHGMYAKIPLVCKADSCPYSENCMILKYDMAPIGEACPTETAEIEARYAGYSSDFELNSASFTDKALVSEIINLDIMIERCKSLMSKEGIPIVDVCAGIDQEGQVIMRPEVSKAVEAYEKFTKKRNEIFQLMMATRRDKKSTEITTVNINDIIKNAIDIESSDGFIIDEKPDHLK